MQGNNYYFYAIGIESAKQNTLSSHSKSVAKLSLKLGIFFFLEKYDLKFIDKISLVSCIINFEAPIKYSFFLIHLPIQKIYI